MARITISEESTVVGDRMSIALGPFFDPAKPETERVCNRIVASLERRGYVPIRVHDEATGHLTIIGRRPVAPASPEPTDVWEGA
jgi:hypothetical protein